MIFSKTLISTRLTFVKVNSLNVNAPILMTSRFNWSTSRFNWSLKKPKVNIDMKSLLEKTKSRYVDHVKKVNESLTKTEKLHYPYTISVGDKAPLLPPKIAFFWCLFLIFFIKTIKCISMSQLFY